MCWAAIYLLGLLICRCQALQRHSWNFSEPLRVCTSSIQDFGARCDDGLYPAVDTIQPLGGWCQGEGSKFCGYDPAVWDMVAGQLGLREGVDYVRVCMGEGGFQPMLDELAGRNVSVGCDIGVSAITATYERSAQGIRFSRGTYRGALAIMIAAPLKSSGMWGFFSPLHWHVWVALVVTALLVPFLVFLFESIMSGRSAYKADNRKTSIMFGMKEALWHSLSHCLQLDVFKVNSLPSRFVTIGYALMVIIITNTYTANLAAFLTVSQLDTSIKDTSDLIGRAVATIQPYIIRLANNHRIFATDQDGWNYDVMIRKLLAGEYAAVISDDTQLVARARADASCLLHILEQTIEPFDLAFAFRAGFPYDTFSAAVSTSILQLRESGSLEDLVQDYLPPDPKCANTQEWEETTQVTMDSLWGLWIILAGLVALAAIITAASLLRSSKTAKRERASAMWGRVRSQVPDLALRARAAAAFAEAGERRCSASGGPAPTGRGIRRSWSVRRVLQKNRSAGSEVGEIKCRWPSSPNDDKTPAVATEGPAATPFGAVQPAGAAAGAAHRACPGAGDAPASQSIVSSATTRGESASAGTNGAPPAQGPNRLEVITCATAEPPSAVPRREADGATLPAPAAAHLRSASRPPPGRVPGDVRGGVAEAKDADGCAVGSIVAVSHQALDAELWRKAAPGGGQGQLQPRQPPADAADRVLATMGASQGGAEVSMRDVLLALQQLNDRINGLLCARSDAPETHPH